MREEQYRVAPELIGMELATVQRRIWAFLLDLVLVLLLSLPLLTAVTLIMTQLRAPKLLPLVREIRQATSQAETDSIGLEIDLVTIELVHDRFENRLPAEIRRAMGSGNPDSLRSIVEQYDITYLIAFSKEPATSFDELAKTGTVGLHPFLGRGSSFIHLGVTFLLYFTFFPFWLKGQSPGKKLLRIRAVRLIGKPLTLFTCFERAGGYSASVATLGTGFLQAFWDAQRQTIHDRIAGTVVIRLRRKQKKSVTASGDAEPSS